MDRQKQLEAFTDRELVDELRRRFAVLDEARALLTCAVGTVKNPRMSEAKAAYWAAWHEYKTTHPDATREQWERSKKRSTRK
jgi:hypothetical protein